MKKNFIIGAVAVLAVVLVAGVMLKGKGSEAVLPIVRITAPAAYVLDADGDRSRELSDGDTLTPPVTVRVADGGAASVNFPDGSVARIQSGTTFTVRSASYDRATGRANTSIVVSLGRLWSKVIAFATPDSSWEVETPTAIAAVRGTAFDTRVTADATSFAGSEDAVTVAPIDPNTKSRVETAAATLGEGKVVQIRNSTLGDLVTGRTKLAVVTLPDAERRGAWFAGNEGEDAKVNALVKTLRDRGLSGTELQKEMRAKLLDEIRKRSGDAPGAGIEGNARGTLSDLWKSGKSQKCTFAFDYAEAKTEGTVFLSGNKMRGDFKMTTAAGDATAIESHMVRDSDWTYVWTSMSPQGFKTRTTDDISGGLGGQEFFDYDQTLNYACSAWSGGDGTFAPPSNITFTSF